MSKFTVLVATASFLAAIRLLAAEQVIPLPATLDGQAVGELTASIEENQLRTLDIDPIRGQLQDLLAPKYFSRIPTNHAVPVPVLESAGIKITFIFESLMVQLAVPVELRRTQNISLQGDPGLVAVNSLRPAAFSACMNVRGGVDYIETASTGSAGFDQPQMAVENFFNFHGLVLENETDFNPGPEKSWEKRDTRLIYDFPADRIRITAGDLDYPVIGFQNFVPMLGLSVNRQDSLQPYRVTSPLGQSAFFLQADSKVDVIINGQVVRSLQLAAGPHQISNFPLTGGANSVILRITDPVGRVEYINARLFYDPGLLKAGESEFNYAVGLPSITDAQSPFYRYDSRPVASAYHRFGLTDRITAGANAQVGADTQVGGGEVVFSTPAGIFDFDSAVSQNKTIGTGTAERLQYHYYAPRASRLAEGQFTLVAQIQSPDYTPISVSSIPVEQGTLVSYQAQYSQRFGEHWFGGLGYSEQFTDSTSQLETWSLTAGFNAGRFYVDATLDHNSGKASHGEWTAFLSLRIALERGQNLFSTYDTHLHASRSEWQYTPADNIESVSGTLGLQATPGQQDYYGNVNYTGRRAELAFYQDALSTGDQRSSLRWGTALVYADGVFAVTRPVQDSFAIFESTGTLATDGGVGVQPQAHRYEAQEDWLGPGVLPQVTAYYPTRVRVDPLRPEADFDPQDGDILLQPTYRSGSLVRLGHPPTLDATVKLLWSDGRPAVCLDAYLVAKDGTRVEFISNREGVAYLSGLVAGSYRVAISGYPDAVVSVIVPPTTARQIDLGEIKLPVKP